MNKIRATVYLLFTIFLLAPFTGSTQIKDVDGKSYRSITIGEQVWLGENLNVSHFRNGDPIAEARTAEELEKLGKEGKPAWCYYDNNAENGKKYGKLYNWFAINDPRGLAPIGWHTPSRESWKKLVLHVGKDEHGSKKLKAKTGWEGDPWNYNGTNESGFSAVPGGRRFYGKFDYIGEYAMWWTTDEYFGTIWDFQISWDNKAIYKQTVKENALYVRCIRDIELSKPTETEGSSTSAVKKENYDLSTPQKFADFMNSNMGRAEIASRETPYYFTIKGKTSFDKKSVQFIVKNEQLYIKMHIPKDGECDYGIKEIKAEYLGFNGLGVGSGKDYVGYVNFNFDHSYECNGKKFNNVAIAIPNTVISNKYLSEFQSRMKEYCK